MKLQIPVRGTAYIVTLCVLSVFLLVGSASGSASASGLDRPAAAASTALVSSLHVAWRPRLL